MELLHFFESNRVQKACLVFFVIIFVVFCIQMYEKANRSHGNDLTSYLLSAKALLSGENPYNTGSPFTFIYPLFLAFILVPLTFIPYWLAALIWYLLNVSALVLSAHIIIGYVCKKSDLNNYRTLFPPLFFMFILMIEIIQNHLLNGQVNFIVLGLMVLFFKYFHCQDKRRWWAAFFLAMAISIKLVPLILIGYILARKDIKLLVVTFCFLVLLVFLPYILVGSNLFVYYSYYLDHFLLRKLATTSGNFFSGHFSYSFHHFISNIFPALKIFFWVKVLTALVVLVPLIILEFRQLYKKYKRVSPFNFCLYLVAILLISPMSETHHMAFYIPAVILIGISILFIKEYSNRLYLALYIGVFVTLIIGKFWNPGIFYFFSIGLTYLLVILMVLKQNKIEISA